MEKPEKPGRFPILDFKLLSLDNIADGSGEGRTKYADYTYLGAGTMVKAVHPAVSGGLELTYGTGGTYGGFDRFGRIIDQKWQNTAATVKDRYTYGYDRNSNRLYRKNEHASGGAFSELYHANGATLLAAYDGLDRLTDFRRGTLSQTNRPNDTISSNISRVQDFGLEALGNWKTFKEDADGSGWDLEQSREHNKVNEIDTDDDHSNGPGASITASTGTNWIDPKFDAVGNMTQGPKAGYEGIAIQRQFCVYDAWNRLVEVWRDKNGDGTKDAEPDDEQLAAYEYDSLNRRIKKVDICPHNSNSEGVRQDEAIYQRLSDLIPCHTCADRLHGQAH